MDEGAHAALIGQALSDVLGRPVGQWIEPLDFNADNGEAILSQYFTSVTTSRWSVDVELHEPGPLVGYLDSGREPIEAEVGQDLPWIEVLDRAEELISGHIRAHGSLRFARRGASLVATSPP